MNHMEYKHLVKYTMHVLKIFWFVILAVYSSKLLWTQHDTQTLKSHWW